MPLDPITLGALACAGLALLFWVLRRRGIDIPRFMQQWEKDLCCESIEEHRVKIAKAKLRREMIAAAEEDDLEGSSREVDGSATAEPKPK